MQANQCAIYTRVSTDNQADKSFNSCRSQFEKIRNYIQSQENWKIYNVFSDEGFSGVNVERPAIQSMIRDIRKHKIDTVLVYKMDRLIRNPKIFYELIELFEEYDVAFISITERFDTSTPAGKLLRNIMLTFAQFERDLASERTKDKMVERAKKGLWNGGNVPFGYEVINKKLIINTREANIVKTIYKKYLETGSRVEVHKYLIQNNLYYRNNKEVSKSNISYILQNPVYTGHILYDGCKYKGIHDSIISQKVFNDIQEYKKPKKREYKLYKKYPLSGLISCSSCGTKMTPHFVNKHYNNKLKRYHYYRCTTTTHKSWDSCPTKQINAQKLQKYLHDNFIRTALDDQYLNSLCLMHERSSVGGAKKQCELSETEIPKPEFLKKHFELLTSALVLSARSFILKKIIEKINYSRERIDIVLNYMGDEISELLVDFPQEDCARVEGWLSYWNYFRTLAWVNSLKYPDLIQNKTQEMLKLYHS